MKVNMEAQSICGNSIRGIPFYTLNIIKSLVKRGNVDCEVSFFDFKKERNNRQFIEKYLSKELDKIQVCECNSISYKDFIDCCFQNDFSRFDRSYKEYTNSDGDIFHFPNSPHFPYAIAENTVVTVHDLMPIIFKSRHYWSEKLTNCFINSHKFIAQNKNITIIADSECTKRDIMKYLDVDSDRIFVTPLGYDEEIHYHSENPEVLSKMGIDAPYLLYLGALDIRKGIFDILKAFNIIKDKYKGLKLVLAGKKDKIFENEFQKRIDEITLDDVIFTGYVSDEQKRALLSSAKAFLFPSEYEGFGLPVLEAMACGAPVITSNVSSLPEVGGDAVLYVTPNQPEELAQQIERVLDSTELRESCIKKGYNRAKIFSWDKTAELTEQVYKTAYERTH